MSQAAKKSYFFDQGYKDLNEILKTSWQKMWKQTKETFASIGEAWEEYNFVIASVLSIFYLFTSFSLLIFGSAFVAIFSALHIVMIMTMMALVYSLFTIMWLIDRSYLLAKKISISCHECKNRYLIPTYKCPKCGRFHDHLTPGVYGIFTRTCNCGEKLPTSIFNRKVKRYELEAVCPVCKGNNIPTKLYDRASRPICIPVVGGASVGKTVFITSFVRQFIEVATKGVGLEIEMYNKDKTREYERRSREYTNGSVTKTRREHNLKKASSVAFSFFIKHKKLSPDRLFHIYDIAGETFAENNENEIQKHYGYANGIVLILDPLSIRRVKTMHRGTINPVDLASISTVSPDIVIERFIEKIQDVTGLAANEAIKIPLAIVINKVDVPGLKNEIGFKAMDRYYRANKGEFNSYHDAMDYRLRQFLIDNEMTDVINHIQMRFKTNRFFACSAMGHSVDSSSYEPQGVLPVIEWIVKISDQGVGRIWNSNQFSKHVVNIKVV